MIASWQITQKDGQNRSVSHRRDQRFSVVGALLFTEIGRAKYLDRLTSKCLNISRVVIVMKLWLIIF